MVLVVEMQLRVLGSKDAEYIFMQHHFHILFVVNTIIYYMVYTVVKPNERVCLDWPDCLPIGLPCLACSPCFALLALP